MFESTSAGHIASVYFSSMRKCYHRLKAHRKGHHHGSWPSHKRVLRLYCARSEINSCCLQAMRPWTYRVACIFRWNIVAHTLCSLSQVSGFRRKIFLMNRLILATLLVVFASSTAASSVRQCTCKEIDSCESQLIQRLRPCANQCVSHSVSWKFRYLHILSFFKIIFITINFQFSFTILRVRIVSKFTGHLYGVLRLCACLPDALTSGSLRAGEVARPSHQRFAFIEFSCHSPAPTSTLKCCSSASEKSCAMSASRR